MGWPKMLQVCWFERLVAFGGATGSAAPKMFELFYVFLFQFFFKNTFESWKRAFHRLEVQGHEKLVDLWST